MSPQQINLDLGTLETFQRSGIATVMQMLLRDESAQKNGVSILCDFRKVNYSVISKASRQDMKRGIAMMQGVMPLRIKAIYLLEPNIITKGIVRVMESFVRADSKVPKRIKSLTMAQLTERTDPASLASDYGGDAGHATLREQWEDKAARILI